MDDSRGAVTAAGQSCGSCGTELPPNAKFCNECGASVTNCWTTYSASESRPGLAAAALAMAAILDKELYVAQQPAAAGRLVQILGMLAKRSNRRGGFLQSVRAMTPADGRGDSGGRTR